MSPRNHERHSLTDEDGARDDELAEALLETRRELSQPIPLQRAPEGFLDRVLRRTLQVVEVIVASLLLRGVWGNRALAAGLAGTASVTGLVVVTEQVWTADAELPPVDAYAKRADADDLLEKLARLQTHQRSSNVDTLDARRADALKRLPVGVSDLEDLGSVEWFDSSKRVAVRARTHAQGAEGHTWRGADVDQVIARAMRKLRADSEDFSEVMRTGGWRCHEGAKSNDGRRHKRHYFDAATGQTKSVAVQCYRL